MENLISQGIVSTMDNYNRFIKDFVSNYLPSEIQKQIMIGVEKKRKQDIKDLNKKKHDIINKIQNKKTSIKNMNKISPDVIIQNLNKEKKDLKNLQNEKKELFNEIQKKKAILILPKLKASIKKVQDSQNDIITSIEDINNGTKETDINTLQKLEKNLFVKEGLKIKEFNNIKCTKYVFKDIDMYENQFKISLIKWRNKVYTHFCMKHNIKITNKKNADTDLIKHYISIERVIAKILDKSGNTFIRTLKLFDALNGNDSDIENVQILEYQIYIMPKQIQEGGCDIMKEHIHIVSSNDEVLTIKSLKSTNNNCAIAMFTNFLKIKIQPNKLRELLKLEFNTPIKYEQLELLVNHFKCDISLYIKNESGLQLIKHTNKYDKHFEAFLKDGHYFLVIKHEGVKDHGICPLSRKRKYNHH